MFPLLGAGLALGSGLLGFLGQKKQNDLMEKQYQRRVSGADMNAAIENAYAPWFGKGWSQRAVPGAAIQQPGFGGGSNMMGFQGAGMGAQASRATPGMPQAPGSFGGTVQGGPGGMGGSMGGGGGGGAFGDPQGMMEMLRMMMQAGKF